MDGDRPIVEIRDLTVEFSGQAVLRDIDMDVPRGETLVVIGESGCGKSVLMKTVIGLLHPTRGTVRFDGHSMQHLSDRELTRQRARFGFLFQQAALFDSLTVGQNIAFPIRQHTDCTWQEVEHIVLSRLADVGLPDAVVYKKPAELSGGMRKRVALARALAMDPEIIVYDEPTTGLDPIMSDVINQLIIRTREAKHITSIVVTHDMNTVRKVASRVVMIYPLARLEPDAAQIIFDGRPDQMDDAPDARVRQFVRGEAGERLNELRRERMVV